MALLKKDIKLVPLGDNIPKGCVGIVNAKGMVSSAIRLCSWYKEKVPKCWLANHAFWMGRNGTIFESNAAGNQERHLTKYFESKYKCWVFSNSLLAEPHYESAEAHALGCLGRMYDYTGLMRFVFRFLPQLKYADFCSELVTRIVRNYCRIPFLKIGKPHEVTPSGILKYMNTDGKSEGWKLVYYWDGEKLINKNM